MDVMEETREQKNIYQRLKMLWKIPSLIQIKRIYFSISLFYLWRQLIWITCIFCTHLCQMRRVSEAVSKSMVFFIHSTILSRTTQPSLKISDERKNINKNIFTIKNFEKFLLEWWWWVMGARKWRWSILSLNKKSRSWKTNGLIG